MKAHAKEHKVDAGRIALIGESAGGHLVSWVETRANEDTRFAAVVPFYAPHDLELQVKHCNMLGESMSESKTKFTFCCSTGVSNSSG